MLPYRRKRGMEGLKAPKAEGGRWRARQDSNPQPLGPKPSALSIELQALAKALARNFPGHSLGRATGFEPVISCATDRRLDHSATLATSINANKYPALIQAH